MEVQNEIRGIVRWSLRQTVHAGERALRAAGQGAVVDHIRLRTDAIGAVEQAKIRFADRVELALGAAFLKRAAVAVGNLAEENPELAEQLAPEVTRIAVERVPDTLAGARLAEEAVEEVWRAPIARLRGQGAVIPMQAEPPAAEQLPAQQSDDTQVSPN